MDDMRSGIDQDTVWWLCQKCTDGQLIRHCPGDDERACFETTLGRDEGFKFTCHFILLKYVVSETGRSHCCEHTD
jgi:hypothetical protein